MKIKLTSLLVLMFFLMANFSALKVNAMAFNELPASKSSKQWLVKIDKPLNPNKQDLQSKKGVYNTYSLAVESIGEDVENVRIESFRDEKNTRTKYGLFTIDMPKISKDDEEPVRFANFPMSVDSNKLEVTITWSKKGEDRKYKEVFTFSN
ncbi:hypothetical protein COJ92_21980 [Priestia megaterium]|uniref:hypothetical protein n=1 Tax=Priestia megaterium TaxID=1404 RepID=UPI000BF5A75A|nr:hypothetical protein [Priestia megaterium]PFP15730.1 hypothetical protein COJ92_21980 [Priestia megaterium]